MAEPTFQIVCAQGQAARPLPLGAPLRGAGFLVDDVSTVDDLISRASAIPDLVVLEDSMPGRRAVDVLRQLRTDPATASVAVLVVGSPGGAAEAVAAGADGYLSVGADPAEVLAWARALLRRQGALRLETLGRLASGLAHDFNNLLTVILGHSGLLRERLPEEGLVGELLDGLDQASRVASRLAGQMLAFARLQPTAPEPINLNALVGELAELLRHAFNGSVELFVRADPNLPLVRGVPAELIQVLLNLCINARDAMPGGGRIVVTTAMLPDPAGTMALLRVEDTGPGIPPDVLPHIFEPFFTTRPGEGSGLGLATVHRIVRQHRGQIECTSEVGRGSRFDVWLPAIG